MVLSEDKYIMLDTMVVAGIFALTKTGHGVEENKKEWKRAVVKLAKNVDNNVVRIVAPPSVCFELMCWNKDWHKMVSEYPNRYPLFSYSNEPIKNEDLKIAAKFAHSCGASYGETGDAKYKLKSLDPSISARNRL